MNATPTEDRKTVEHQLRSHDAHLDAALRWFDRQLSGRDVELLRRLELRYSTRLAKPFDKALAQQRIVALSKTKGVVGIEVSVRQHELPLDNDLGHVTLRALYLARDAQPGDASGKSWLSRLRDRLLGSDDVEAQAADSAVDIPLQLAVAKLSEGIDLAAKAFAQGSAGKTVGGVVITVFAPKLHQMLSPKMPPADTLNATPWIAREVRARGLLTDPALVVHYHFQEPVSDSTDVPTHDDMTVLLLAPSEASERESVSPGESAPNVKPTEAPLAPVFESEGTVMPVPEPAKQASPPTVNLRLLGTWHGGRVVPLTAPFGCSLGPVPALLSRSTLEMQGFTRRADAALARAASNSTPLYFSPDGRGGIKLHAAHRPGGTLPMYFFLEGLAPCTGEHPLDGPVRLLVNGPDPLQDGLYPLVIEVSPSQ
jgi:hypothetical protein